MDDGYKRFLFFVVLVACSSAASAAPYYTSDFLFERNDRYPHSHGSTIVQLPNDDLLAAWYAGAREKASDVVVLAVRRQRGQSQWGTPYVLADDPKRTDGNPVLFVDREGVVWLFYNVMYGSGKGRTRQGSGWTTCKIHYNTCAWRLTAVLLACGRPATRCTEVR